MPFGSNRAASFRICRARRPPTSAPRQSPSEFYATTTQWHVHPPSCFEHPGGAGLHRHSQRDRQRGRRFRTHPLAVLSGRCLHPSQPLQGELRWRGLSWYRDACTWPHPGRRVSGRLVGTSAVLCNGWAMVVPGSPDKSLLYQKLLSTSPCGERMPLMGHLPDGDVECIREWIVGIAGSGGCETCGGSECVTLASDAANCGQCGNACPEGVTCENGSCACPAGQTGCGDSCVDTLTDVQNCGGCGLACSPGSTCAAGQCSCPEPLPRVVTAPAPTCNRMPSTAARAARPAPRVRFA